MVYDYNLMHQAQQDIKDAYWDAMERYQAQLEDWYEREYNNPTHDQDDSSHTPKDPYSPYRYAERDY